MKNQISPTPFNVVESMTKTANGCGHIYLVDANGRKIAALWGTLDEKVANASLFIAAPELLDAAEGLLKFLRISLNAGPLSENPKEEIKYLEAMRKAIRKAKGDDK